MAPTLEEEPTAEPTVMRRKAEASSSAPPVIAKPMWPRFAMVALIAVLAGAAGTFAGLRVLGWTGAKSAATLAAVMPDMNTAATNAGRPASAGDKAVQISPERQQLIGVRTATVEHRTLDTTVRTVGTLAYDETRVTQIHTKIAGWVERLFVDYVGKNVKRGEPLFTVYSPDLVSTQKEYLLALKARKQLSTSQFEETRSGAESLVTSARERLKLWDISDDQIAELERTGEPRKTLTLYSPFSGIVLERNTFAGQYLTPEMSTFKIADLSTIWVLGQVFEYELQYIKLGQEAQVEFPYGQSTRTLKGRVTFIYPEIDPQTRRAKVRIEFQNPGLEFKPQTYVTVILKTPGGHQLALPKEAVIDNGSKQYAILALANGYFEPREIKVGPAVDDAYPIVSGLNAGDRVVTSAQFLVDSETNLQSALGAMSMNMPGMNTGGSKAAGDVPKAGDTKDDSMKGMQMPATPASKP